MATSKGTPAWKVLLDCEDSFKRFMKLEKIVPPLMEKKLLKKKLGKLIMKKQDTELLAATTQKEWGHEQFISYLEVLIELCRKEGPEGNTLHLMQIMKGSLEAMNPESNSKLDSTIRTFKETIDSSVGSQVERTESTTIPGIISELEHQNSSLQTQTLSADSPMQPPAGQIGNAISHVFTSEGGVLYSPVHGASVLIPPNSIPADVGKFNLSMHFYLGQPFTTEEGVDLCSVVVWFHHQPFFEFLEDVTVEIPHAASTDPTSLRVLTWGEGKQGPPYKLDTEVPADFSDGYHAVFKVKHFSPYSVALNSNKKVSSPQKKKAESKATRSKKMEKLRNHRSNSLERSFDDSCTVTVSHGVCDHSNGGASSSVSDGTARDVPELSRAGQESKIGYRIVCYMPEDRSGAEWEATFAACYNHPSGNWALQLVKKYGEKLYGSGCNMKHACFRACCDYLELHPQSWKDSSWRVFASETNILSIQDIEEIPRSSPKQEFEELISAKLYPPSVTYSVQRSGPPPNTALRCRIDVTGAQAQNKAPPFFVLTSSSPVQLQFNPQTEQVLYTSAYLYGDKSDILKALTSPTRDIALSTSSPDHVKFLAELSFQLVNPTLLSHALELSQLTLDQITMECQHIGDVCFSSYKLLTDWVSRKGRDAKLSSLKSALFTTGTKDIITKTPEDVDHVLIRPAFDECPFPNICSSEYVSTANEEVTFVYKLSRMLRCCWRRVGSLMGIPLVRLDEIDVAAASDTSSTPGYNMLLEWQKRNGREATLGTLFRALKCAFYYRPSDVNHAYWYATEEAEKLISSLYKPQSSSLKATS